MAAVSVWRKLKDFVAQWRCELGFVALVGVGVLSRLHPAYVQDDAAYVLQAQNLLEGRWEMHPDVFASIWPQAILGGGLWKLVGTPLVLVWATWAVLQLTAVSVWANQRWTWTRTLGVMAVPYWIQYGSSFLYDIYGALAVAVAVGIWAAREITRMRAIALAMAVAAMVLQTQFLALVPLWMLMQDGKFKQPKTWSVAGGLVFALALLMVLPKSLGQLGHLEFLKTKAFWVPQTFVAAFQILLGVGWFLLPLFEVSRQNILGAIGAWIAAALTLVTFPGPLLAGGVMLIEYMPRPVQAAAVALGAVGWAGTWDAWRRVSQPTKGRRQMLTWLTVLGAVAVFQGYRGVNDMRVALVWMPVTFWVLAPGLKHVLADRALPVAVALVVSGVLNASMISIAEQRFAWTRDLVERGIPRELISAGYGADHLALEAECMRREQQRLTPEGVQHPRFIEEIYKYIPKVYQRGWRPQHRILPTRVLGKATARLPEGYRVAERRSWKLLGIFPQEITRFELEPRLTARVPDCLAGRGI